MTFKLKEWGYQFDPECRVWMRDGYGGIVYSDGDVVEQRIARILADAADVSLFSEELVTKCIDWPSTYHLSATRANILRPFKDILSGARVLEIGAGCGAITRFLGESGSDVLALEGSPRRAAIVRSRTRDLQNITVLCEKFEQIEFKYQFDVITLIGVLEYANLFTSDENPSLAMLRQVCSHLKPGGKLIVAIENQFGLKYFAGAPEDHLGQPMYGIEGRYRKDQPQTFGRRVLANLLSEAGFGSAHFMAPFPDYKLPVSIITESGFAAADFDASALAWQSVRRDPQLPHYLFFSPELAWPDVVKNGIALDLANSFLIVASPSIVQKDEGKPLAYHYSTDRRPVFCKEACFLRDSSGMLSVFYGRLGSCGDDARGVPVSDYRFSLPERDDYALGSPLSREFVEIVSIPGWSMQIVSDFIGRYLELLRVLLRREGDPRELKSVHESLPGRYLDAVPQNLILDADRRVTLIDTEWSAEFGVELGRLLFRGLLLMIAGVTRFAPSFAHGTLSRRQFIEGVLEQCRLPLSTDDFSRYLGLEAEFQEFVTGRSASEFMNWWPEELLPGLGIVRERDNVTLYLAPQGGAFSETWSVRHAIHDRRSAVEFSLPESLSPQSRLRCDPSERQGWYRVYALELRDKFGNRRWAWAFGSNDVVSAGLEILQDTQEPNAILLYAVDADPQLLINLPPEVLRELEPGWVMRLDLEKLDGKDLVKAVTERDGQIASLSQAVTERDGQIASLSQAVTERDGQIASLSQAVTERDGQIASLS
ncbi:MAG: class I SAM-dependent methyltransferase, partial [Trichloromonadaceae bacterium]